MSSNIIQNGHESALQQPISPRNEHPTIQNGVGREVEEGGQFEEHISMDCE